jgi:hypothetical protein
MKKIRELIAVEEGKEDINYFLVQSAEGEVCVETFYSPNKPFVRGRDGRRIYPDEFDRHIIDGKPLRHYVDEKLNEIDHSSPA